MPETHTVTTSPITPQDVAVSEVAISWVGQDAGEVWWVRGRPDQEGRYGLFRATEDGAECLTADGSSVRTRLHEYGGRPWTALPDGRFCFVEWADQRLYVQAIGESPRPISPTPPIAAGFRYAEPIVVGDEIWVLREELHSEVPTDVTRDFVALPLDGSAADDAARVRVLGARTHHFLAGLCLSPDGSKAAWIGWDHPYMPWDRSEVVVADIVDGAFVEPHVIAGGAPTPEAVGDGIAICQVGWESDDTLLYLSDVSGWFNLYRHRIGEAAVPIYPVESELGGPLWRVGQRWFAVVSPGVFAVLDHGRLSLLDEAAGTLEPVPQPDELTKWSPPLSAFDGRVAGVAYGPRRLSTVATFGGGEVRAIGGSAPLPVIGGAPIDIEWLPEPELRWFDTADGAMVPTNLYLPTNGDASGATPFVVHIHGGPTGQNGTSVDLEVAYFTSRGIGVAVPEYGGSTGFGRLWRERLNGQWGVVDLADAVSVAEELVSLGLADPERLGIRGGSAGGFTTALALTTPSPFVAGCARYPIVDLLAFSQGETHDFESQYLTSIVGPLPEAEQVYVDRSPVTHAASLHAPILVLQGLEDEICQPRTTQRFIDALVDARKELRYRTYEGEQHGFRQPGTVADAIDVEFRYFAEIFGMDA